MKERLQKYLARAGIASRRGAEAMIIAGRIQVNDQVVSVLGLKVLPGVDVVKVDGKIVQPPMQLIYLMMNKPKGYVTTVHDERGRKTVLDLITNIPERIYPVGRLDMDTEGLLLLTNDGTLAYGLTHPKHEIRKTYHALVQGNLQKNTVHHLRRGIMLDGRKTAPANVKIMKEFDKSSLVEIIIHEGRNRQVRRMFAKVGHPVKQLKRVKLAFLDLGNLVLGTYRHLTQIEVDKLYRLISNSKDKLGGGSISDSIRG